VGEASNGEEAIILAHEMRPDVLVMDISLPGISGIEATRQLIRETPETRIIAFSMHEQRDVAEALQDAGAVGFVSKSEPSEHLIRAIHDWGARKGA
jgi:DNA-binding NarL/FixJ family response regulator